MPEFPEAFVACIAQALRTTQVLNVLWGYCLFNVYGVLSVIMANHSLLHPTKLELPPHFILASDQAVLPPWRPGRGTGLFKSSRDLIVVPKSHILLEAYMRLYARDFGKPVGNFGMAMICCLEGYVDSDGLLDIQQLPAPLKTLYVELRDGRKPGRQWTIELRDALALPELNRFSN
ncbi:hypothetical protein B0T26DRAFT_655685 [Lasiosphaeria miniovina]|uniref:Uncharacterized protein n=1 Tax=Lasiosphaeria miniovina TaxID=1954250 RepID=A0AA40A029_9PEZI|nr:uncharacterized protein B0T26DRAFT_655685 [Lasiosphaeria miniovina]KAK0706797.1 hypothetical protein B0T26DRAFT_655685 [Lasiosphaeria miniovina]